MVTHREKTRSAGWLGVTSLAGRLGLALAGANRLPARRVVRLRLD
jgi:hypothetical protein